MTYELWDVFSTEPFASNALAVVPDASGLNGVQMQRVANEFNLSETSFVMPSETADVRARYFTPAQELPMAGHPSVGTVFALERTGLFENRDEVTLELGVGPVTMTLERDGGDLRRVWMDQGVPQLLETFDKAQVARALGLELSDLEPDLPARLGSAGNPFLLVPVVSLDALARSQVSLAALSTLLPSAFRAIFVFTRRASDADVRARMFSVTYRIDEDPATGSAHRAAGRLSGRPYRHPEGRTRRVRERSRDRNGPPERAVRALGAHGGGRAGGGRRRRREGRRRAAVSLDE